MPRKIENFTPEKPFIHNKKTYIFVCYWIKEGNKKLLMYRDNYSENNILSVYEDGTIKELFG